MMRLIVILSFAALAAPARIVPCPEAFPARPYVAPPTPPERAQAASNAWAMARARAAERASLAALALRVSAPTGQTAEAVQARAEALDAISGAVDNNTPLTGSAGTGAAAVAAAIAGYLAGRKINK